MISGEVVDVIIFYFILFSKVIDNLITLNLKAKVKRVNIH